MKRSRFYITRSRSPLWGCGQCNSVDARYRCACAPTSRLCVICSPIGRGDHPAGSLEGFASFWCLHLQDDDMNIVIKCNRGTLCDVLPPLFAGQLITAFVHEIRP